MKTIYTYTQIGRWMLWLSFCSSLLMLFEGLSYRLRPEHLSEEQAEVLHASRGSLFEQRFGSHLGFLSELNDSFEAYDNAQRRGLLGSVTQTEPSMKTPVSS